MSQSIRLYSFADVDRSGKVRWTAYEVGLEVEESRLSLGEHVTPEYLALNPYAQVPTAEIDGEVLVESTAICLVLAQRYPECGLIPGDAVERESFWQNVALATTTLEQPVVEYLLSRRGLIDEARADQLEKPLQRRIGTFAEAMPGEGYLHSAFTLADIFAAYILRIGMQSGLLAAEGPHADYLARLRRRPAAVQARFFDSLDA